MSDDCDQGDDWEDYGPEEMSMSEYDEEEEHCCEHCGKPFEDFSDMGCRFCDRRNPTLPHRFNREEVMNPRSINQGVEEWWKSKMQKHWIPSSVIGCGEPHLINLISESRGWLPLQPNQRMTVTIDGAEYEIIRKA